MIMIKILNFTPLKLLVILPSLYVLYGATRFDTNEPKVVGVDFGAYTFNQSPALLPITEEDGLSFLTHPEVKAPAFPENLPANREIEMPSYPSSSETALKRLRTKDGHSIDGRSPIHHPEKDAFHRVHAQLMMHFSDGEYGGSGTLIGPHHLITAAHNLYNRSTNSWASRIRVRFALNGNYLPFDQQLVARAYTYDRWLNGNEQEAQSCDLALFVLDHSIGDRIGWHGLSYLPNDSAALSGEISIAGYPADISDTAFQHDETRHTGAFKKMWRMANVTNKNNQSEIVPVEYSDTNLYYLIDTSGGQSGSGIVWVKEPGKAYVIGVHAYGEGHDGRENYGTRLTKDKLSDLQKWISATYEVIKQKGTPRPNIQLAPVPAAQAVSVNNNTRGVVCKGNSTFSARWVETKGSTGPTQGMVLYGLSKAQVKENVETQGEGEIEGAELNDEANLTIGGKLITKNQ